MKAVSGIRNREVADILYEIAGLLQVKGVPFKPRAYRRAAQTIETLPEDISAIHERGELEDIPGIGSSIASKIAEIIARGNLAYLETLKEELPEGVQELIQIEGIGPKRALLLYRQLRLRGIEDLESAARQGRIRGLKGFGKKSEENILSAIRRGRESGKRHPLGEILPIAQDIQKNLSALDAVDAVSLTGSIRRKRETVGDIDILVASGNPHTVMDFFCGMQGVRKVLACGKTKSMVLLANGIEVDLRVVAGEQFGAALQYFTGSKEHNVRLRELALSQNLKLNEYGLIDRKTGKIVASEQETEIYRALGLEYIEPELREDRGEIGAARDGRLPGLIRHEDVKGDLHVHTRWSEGAHSIEEMAKTARALGYEYIAICDHTKALPIARGLSEEKIREQMQEIETLNREMDDFAILSGVEGNIDKDGNLDIRADVLQDLDIVVASIHSGFKQSEEEITRRVLSAMHNDHVDIIGHPTGRIINQRRPYPIDLGSIFTAASELGVCLEINAYPRRLDLSDINCFNARKYGVTFSIGSDAHNKSNLRYMEFGIATARRGWLEATDVINTLHWDDLEARLKIS
jgi:DNA polymerase (family X)